MTYAKVVGLVAGLLFFQIAQAQATGFVVVLESAPLRLLGRVSYGAYLFHPFIHFQGLLSLVGLTDLGGRAPAPVQILVEFAVTVALATASWVLLERPILRRAALLTSQAPFAGKARGAKALSTPRGETT